jgi:GTP pyrophosphokinase
MVGAKVDGKIVPLDYKVKTGEIVEVMTSSQQGKGPSRDWLNIVKTSQARSKIRQWFKKERREENIAEGKAQIEREFKRNFIRLNEAEYNEFIEKAAERQHCKDIDDFYAAIGYGGISLVRLMPKFKEDYSKLNKADESEIKIVQPKKKTKSKEGVVVEGIDNCLIKFSRCCNPLPGDDIIGFITRGHGVSIHTRNCTNVPRDISTAGEPDRWITAYWDNNIKEDFKCTLSLFCLNRIGMLADISVALADMRVDILQINVQTTSGGSIVTLKVGCKNTDHYASIVSRLRSIPGIYDVSRGFVN